MELDIYNITGYIGSVIYVFSYALLNLNKIEGKGLLYIGMNLLAAILICFSLIKHWNGPAFAMEVFWIFFSIIGIIRLIKK